jgi:hypothetical protein
MQIASDDTPIKINGVKVDLPDSVTLPVDTHEIDWTDDLPPDSDVEEITQKTIEGYNEGDKSNWMNDAIARELREQQDVPPGPDEAKRMLLEKAERDWGYSAMQLNRIKRDYPILFDFISADKYEKAKKFLKKLHTEEGVIEYHELQWSLDMLEGRESIELS